MADHSAPRAWLIVLDVDGVIFRSHFLLEMSRRVGLWAYCRAWLLCCLFNAGIVPFTRLLARVYERFAGQPEDAAWDVYRAMRIIPHAAEAGAAWQAAGHKVIAVSSGVPERLLDDLAKRLHLDAHAGVALGLDADARLDGTVSGELTKPGGKIAVVERMQQRFGSDWEHTIVAADDRNNVELVERAGVSIGVRPNWPVRRRATYVADQADMDEVRSIVDGHLASHAPKPPSHEGFRKWVHATGCLLPFTAKVSLAGTTAVMALVAAAYTLSEVWRLNGMSVPAVTWVTRHSVRPEELRRPSTGPLCLTAACLICLWCFPWPVATAAVFIACLSDTMAALVGQRWGRHRLPFNRSKSFEGTAAFFIVGVASTAWLLPLPACLAACGVGALVEALPLKDADNLLVPLAAAAAAMLANGV